MTINLDKNIWVQIKVGLGQIFQVAVHGPVRPTYIATQQMYCHSLDVSTVQYFPAERPPQ